MRTVRRTRGQQLKAAASPRTQGGMVGQQGARLPPEGSSRGLEKCVCVWGGGIGSLSAASLSMRVPHTMAPCCLKARPPFQPIRYLGEFYLVFVLCGTDCILVPWIALPFTQSTLSVSLTSSQPLMSSLGRGLFSRSACTFRDWEERAFIMHCSSLHLKTHLKMPEHLVSTFVYAVDLIFDLSYLIKCFLKRCFSLFQ